MIPRLHFARRSRPHPFRSMGREGADFLLSPVTLAECKDAVPLDCAQSKMSRIAHCPSFPATSIGADQMGR